MFDLLWNLHQQGQISDAKSDATTARQDATTAGDRVRELEARLDRLTLATQALWELARGRFDVSDAELLAKIEEIDLRDGQKDQRISPRAQACPKCQRRINTRHAACIYCGTAVIQEHAFQ